MTPYSEVACDQEALSRCLGQVLTSFDRRRGVALAGIVVHVDEDAPVHMHLLYRWVRRKPHGRARITEVFPYGSCTYANECTLAV